VFNDYNIALMRVMASEGKSAAEIAERIGSTPGSVRVLASELGIRLRSRKVKKEPNGSVRLNIIVSPAVSTRLSLLAEHAGLRSASELARNYLEALARSSDKLRHSPLDGHAVQDPTSAASFGVSSGYRNRR
jgi:hypothetical protein